MLGCHAQREQMFNLIWGYNAIYTERVFTLMATTGDNLLLGTVVPSGEAWVVTAMSASDRTTNWGITDFMVNDGTLDHRVAYFATGIALEWKCVNGWWVIPAGGRAAVLLRSVTLNDDLYASFIGYKMKLTQ